MAVVEKQGGKVEHVIMVYGRGDKVPENAIVVNATSRSKEAWSKGLSPFYLGPVPIDETQLAMNMENAWQYCKVYEEYLENPELGEGSQPSQAYYQWAKSGFENKSAVRFPMGRGACPAYSIYGGKRMGYIEARARIYCPLYANAVKKTNAYHRLQCLYKKAVKEGKVLAIFDFDGHNSIEYFHGDYEKILYNHKRKMGHGFVLAMLLENDLVWEQEYDEKKVHHTSVPRRK